MEEINNLNNEEAKSAKKEQDKNTKKKASIEKGEDTVAVSGNPDKDEDMDELAKTLGA